MNLNFSTFIRAYAIDKPVKLRVCFQGVTYARGASSHKADVALNSVTLDTAQWEDQVEYISESTMSQVNLHRNNWLILHCRDNNGTTEGTDPKWDVYLNWIEIDYWREFKADGNRLEFSTETFPPVHKAVQFTVEGFTSSSIAIFQIDKSAAIARIHPRIEQDGNSYKVTFEDDVSQPTRYFATITGAMMRPSKIVKDEPSMLHDPANRVDYIMITHPDFRESTQRLADFRRKQGLSVMVVDIQDVYDEFSHGVFDPTAIRRFLRYAYTVSKKDRYKKLPETGSVSMLCQISFGIKRGQFNVSFFS